MNAPHRIRWFQFRLRSVAFTVTLLAIGLGTWRVYIGSFKAEREALAAITDAGGSARTRPGGPTWLRNWLGTESFRHVVAADLSQAKSSEGWAELLPRLPQLKKLSLGAPDFADERLRPLRRLKELRSLTIQGTQLTRGAVESLKQQLPGLDVQYAVTFAELDLKRPFDHSALPNSVARLIGNRVRLRGFMLPSFQQKGITKFILHGENYAMR